MRPLVVATRNAHKVREISEILCGSFDVRDLTSIPDAPEIEETGSTFEENAMLKALAISSRTDAWVLADDSGLEVDALGGAPGVRSARYAGEPADDAANNALLLRHLAGIRGRARSARFRCSLALAHCGKLIATFSGAVEGIIINELPERGGTGGFGYDPLFVPDGYCETFGQLPPDVKNSISHRARALEKLAIWIESNELPPER
jgi:XTP/dITP diphosphohydrolase